MQPPSTSAYLRDHIAQLKMEAEARNNKPSPVPIALNSVQQYVQKISAWIIALPTSQQQRKYSIDEVIALAELKGQYAELPSQSNVAEALREVGFTQVRSWKKADRSKRFWVYKQHS